MKTSIIIPCHNSEAFIGDAIESVLVQTLWVKTGAKVPQDCELIIIDDASTDRTAEIVRVLAEKNPSIKYFKNPTNLGISKSRNRGIAEATADQTGTDDTYIAMLDSDDIWLDQNKLATQVAFLESHPDHAIVGTWMVQIDDAGKETGRVHFAETDEEIRSSLLYRNHIAQSSVLFRKSAALAAGLYNETMATMEDHDLWLAMGALKTGPNKLATLPIYALGYRVHDSNTSRSHRTRVALDELTAIWKHRAEYPGLFIGLIKGIARLLISLI